MRGLSYRLPCIYEGPEDYALVALGEDGVLYALSPDLQDDIEAADAATALGFDPLELREQYPCVDDWKLYESRPLMLVAATDALTARQRAMIAWSLITHHPGADLMKPVRWALVDVRLALVECTPAIADRLASHERWLKRNVFWDRETPPAGRDKVKQQTRFLLECVQDLVEATLTLCTKEDEHGGELKLIFPEIMRKMMVANIRYLMKFKLREGP